MSKKLGINEISMTKILPAVKDLNEVVVIDPPIPAKIGIKKEDMIKELGEFFAEGPIEQKHYDKLKKQSIETLEALGFDLLGKGGKKKEEPKEETTETSEAETGKKGKGKAIPASKKAEAKKPAVKKAPAEKKEKKPSNKLKVYQSWIKDKKQTVEKLNKIAPDIKPNTIKSWVSDWGRGKNLPGGIF